MLYVGQCVMPSLSLISRLTSMYPYFKYDSNSEFYIYAECLFQRFDFIVHGMNKTFTASKKELFPFSIANSDIYDPEDLSLNERLDMFLNCYYNKEYLDG